MRTSLVVIFLVRIEQMAEMSLAEDNNMVKTLPSDRTDEPLRISVLPWRPWRDRSISYAVFCLKKKEDIAIDAISIANDVPWRLLPAVGFGQLTGNPVSARACGHTQPHKLTAGMLQDLKFLQKPQRDRRDYEQIHRRDALGMIAQKKVPSPRRRGAFPLPASCHARLADDDA